MAGIETDIIIIGAAYMTGSACVKATIRGHVAGRTAACA